MQICTLLALAFVPTATAAIVDGIAITAGSKVITASEVALRIRLTAFENGVPPVFDAATRKRAAQQLIDQKLVEREMDVGHYPHVTSEKRKGLLTEYAASFFHSDPAAMAQALKERSLSATDLQEDLARQTDLLTFLELRFRPAVQIDNLQLANERADADMEAWLREQRKRTRIEYLDKDLEQ